MTKKIKICNVILCVLLGIVSIVFILFSGLSTNVAFAAEIEVNPDDTYYHEENEYETCNVYFESDVFPIVVHCVNYAFDAEAGGLMSNGVYVPTEYDITISSNEDYLKVSTCERQGSTGYFYGTVITSIKCKGYSPSKSNINFEEKFMSWDNNLSVNENESGGYVFFGYGVEDTSVKNITLSFLGGYDEGYEAGYDDGVQDGYDTGYDYGYRLGVESVQGEQTTTPDTDENTDNSSTTNTNNELVLDENWKTLLGIGGGLILLAVVVVVLTNTFKKK